MYTGKFYYRISSLEKSSTRYGPCEVCGDHASEVHFQTESREYIWGGKSRMIRDKQCKDLFGHKQCLLDQRGSLAVVK